MIMAIDLGLAALIALVCFWGAIETWAAWR
jgi:hypothetical protein